jgi:hypothetical protein
VDNPLEVVGARACHEHRVGDGSKPLGTIGAVTSPGPEPDAAEDTTGPARTALPSVGARVLAFAAILLAGAAGAFIGFAFVDLQTEGDNGLQTGLGLLVGGVLAAGGTAVVAVLTLRAMGEWRTIQDRGGPPPTPQRGRRPPSGPGAPPPRVR